MKIGDKVLVTTDNWFFAPDGESYRAVYGTVNAILNDTETLGIKTNARATNWYTMIGNMLVAGCQIHYVIKTDKCSTEPPTREFEYNGEVMSPKAPTSRIYFAD